MKNIARVALKSGMEIAEDVYSYKNDLLVSAGTIVDDVVIAKLSRYSIMCVFIKEDIDYATTHFEKIRLTSDFKAFEEQYSKSLLLYKAIMISFSTNGISFQINQLMQIYRDISVCASTEVRLLDYLYNMIPGEDDMTHAHCLNAALIAGVFGSWWGLPREDHEILIQCGFCYDIGKLKLTDDLLWKPEKLTDDEYEKMKTHTQMGYQMLQNQYVNPHIKNATLMHHERLDGSGYPAGLKQEEIDIFAKYIAIVDSYEAMTSARTYRQSQHVFQVIHNFEQSNGFKYDNQILRPILKRLAQSQLGFTVLLNNDVTAEVILINDAKLSRPLLKSGEELIDLSVNPQLGIVNVY